MSDRILNGVYASVTLRDGTPTAAGPPATTNKYITLTSDNSDFALTGLNGGVLNEDQFIERRGQPLGIAPGAISLPEISFTVKHVAELSHASKKTVQAFVLGLAPFGDRVSTLGADHYRFACDVEFVIDDGTAEGQTIECEDWIVSIDFADGDETMTWSLSGPVWGRDVKINGVSAAKGIDPAHATPGD